MVSTIQTSRMAALLRNLDKAAQEYQRTKTLYDRARVDFEMAEGQFTRTKELASEMMTKLDWYHWQSDHPTVRYAATQIGPTIIQVLGDQAWLGALEFLQGNVEQYLPALFIESIANELETGGFDFRSTSPLREINAALINLAGVLKTDQGAYYVANTNEILEATRQTMGSGK